MPTQPKVVEVEVVREPPPLNRTAAMPPQHSSSAQGIEGPPIHALSALLLVAVDNLWLVADWAVVTWAITIPASFCTVAFPVFLVQKYLKKDGTGRALAFAVVLGALAAIPTSITGTPVGLALLAWTGLSKLWGGSRGRPLP